MRRSAIARRRSMSRLRSTALGDAARVRRVRRSASTTGWATPRRVPLARRAPWRRTKDSCRRSRGRTHFRMHGRIQVPATDDAVGAGRQIAKRNLMRTRWCWRGSQSSSASSRSAPEQRRARRASPSRMSAPSACEPIRRRTPRSRDGSTRTTSARFARMVGHLGVDHRAVGGGIRRPDLQTWYTGHEQFDGDESERGQRAKHGLLVFEKRPLVGHRPSELRSANGIPYNPSERTFAFNRFTQSTAQSALEQAERRQHATRHALTSSSPPASRSRRGRCSRRRTRRTRCRSSPPVFSSSRHRADGGSVLERRQLGHDVRFAQPRAESVAPGDRGGSVRPPQTGRLGVPRDQQ